MSQRSDKDINGTVPKTEIKEDLSNIYNIDKFCNEMAKVASECYRVLKPNKYCGILIEETRRKKTLHSYGL